MSTDGSDLDEDVLSPRGGARGKGSARARSRGGGGGGPVNTKRFQKGDQKRAGKQGVVPLVDTRTNKRVVLDSEGRGGQVDRSKRVRSVGSVSSEQASGSRARVEVIDESDGDLSSTENESNDEGLFGTAIEVASAPGASKKKTVGAKSKSPLGKVPTLRRKRPLQPLSGEVPSPNPGSNSDVEQGTAGDDRANKRRGRPTAQAGPTLAADSLSSLSSVDDHDGATPADSRKNTDSAAAGKPGPRQSKNGSSPASLSSPASVSVNSQGRPKRYSQKTAYYHPETQRQPAGRKKPTKRAAGTARTPTSPAAKKKRGRPAKGKGPGGTPVTTVLASEDDDDVLDDDDDILEASAFDGDKGLSVAFVSSMSKEPAAAAKDAELETTTADKFKALLHSRKKATAEETRRRLEQDRKNKELDDQFKPALNEIDEVKRAAEATVKKSKARKQKVDASRATREPKWSRPSWDLQTVVPDKILPTLLAYVKNPSSCDRFFRWLKGNKKERRKFKHSSVGTGWFAEEESDLASELILSRLRAALKEEHKKLSGVDQVAVINDVFDQEMFILLMMDRASCDREDAIYFLENGPEQVNVRATFVSDSQLVDFDDRQKRLFASQLSQ